MLGFRQAKHLECNLSFISMNSSLDSINCFLFLDLSVLILIIISEYHFKTFSLFFVSSGVIKDIEAESESASLLIPSPFLVV